MQGSTCSKTIKSCMGKNLVLMTKEVVQMVISKVEVIGKKFIKE